MTTPLFRKEAIDAQRHRLWGEVIVFQPLSFWLMTLAVLLVVSTVGAWLAWGTYAKRERVTGIIVPEAGLVKVFAPRVGVIESLSVVEGQHVEADAALLVVRSDESSASGQAVDATVLAELARDRKRLQASIDQAREMGRLQGVQISRRIAGLEAEIDALRAQISSHQQRLDAGSEQLQKLRGLLAQGYVAEQKFTEQRSQYVAEVEQHKALQRDLIRLGNQRDEARAALRQQPLQTAKTIAELSQQLSELTQREVQARVKRSYRITAPIAGTVTSIQAAPGAAADPRRPLLAIIPAHNELQAELFVPTRAAGFIATGQRVWLRYSAFPYQQYGLYQGRVHTVARSILAPGELGAPVSLQEPVYRVRVRLGSQQIHAYGQHFPLQPGMLLDADIVLRERSLVDWLLEPLYRMRGGV